MYGKLEKRYKVARKEPFPRVTLRPEPAEGGRKGTEKGWKIRSHGEDYLEGQVTSAYKHYTELSGVPGARAQGHL